MVLLSLRFPLAASVAAVLLLGPARAALVALLLSLAAAVSWLALRLFLYAPKREDTIAFFHPNAAGGGGGERVLWCAVQSLQKRLPHVKIAILCDERLSAASLRRSAKETFGVDLRRDVDVVVPLRDVSRLEPRRHPRLTLLSQSLAGGLLALEGIRKCQRKSADDAAAVGIGGTPALFVDTSGWPLSFLVAKAAGCDVASYVHYPIVSSDMLARVQGSGDRSRSGKGKGNGAEGGEKNAFAVAGGGGNSSSSPSFASKIRSAVKTAYYHLVASCYGALGGLFCDVTVANSSWTAGHLEALWWRPPFSLSSSSFREETSSSEKGEGETRKKSTEPKKAKFSSSVVVYPPCGASSLCGLPLERAPLPEEFFGGGKRKAGGGGRGKFLLLALAQFRPEKNQAALLRAFALARRGAAAAAAGKQGSNSSLNPVLSSRLALVGGVRDAADAARVDELRALAAELGLARAGGKKKVKNDDESDDDAVVFITNAPRESLRRLLSSATAGLHAMVDEHFGICVVEYMSAGVVPIAHDSAGPKMDIVVDEEEDDDDEETLNLDNGGENERRASSRASSAPPRRSIPTGFLCSTEEEYAEAITRLLLLADAEGGESAAATTARTAMAKRRGRGEATTASTSTSTSTSTIASDQGTSPPRTYSAIEMAAAARRRALRLFDDSAFDEGFVGALEPLLSRVERGCKSMKKEKSK